MPFDAGSGLALKIRNIAMRNGLICYPCDGTANGTDGTHVLLAPPFIYEEQHITELVDKLDLTLKQVLDAE
jgi:adenosylmethionine-8-amino-7-oxononanoate aminotransferase